MRKIVLLVVIAITALLLIQCGTKPPITETAAPSLSSSIDYPVTRQIPVTDNYHGTLITDNYRWLEDAEDPQVIAWTEAQELLTHSIIDPLPQREYLVERFNELWRYDDESVPRKVIDGERIFVWTKKKDDEKWVFNTKVNEAAEMQVLLDPNTWDPTETLGGTSPSRDGKLLAYGVAHGGDENPVYRIMNVETSDLLADTLLGWKQRVTSWLPDNSGFYYSAKPLKGEVPEGEEEYWPAAYLHILGTPADEDVKVFSHDEVKEYWHSVSISEDGKYEIYYRSLFNKNEVFFKPVNSDEPLITLTEGFDAKYSVDFIEDKILIKTDLDAPMNKAFITDVDKPERANWREFLPESENDKLEYISGIAGKVYTVYQHNAHTVVKIYDLEGNYIRDLCFPTIGVGSVSGYWSKPDIWVSFSSFTYPSTTFKYDFDCDSLVVYRKYPVEINVEDYTAEQVWYNSKDGTPVSMFLVHSKDIKKDGNNPALLYGYGGFNISLRPRFSTSYVVWLEMGGMVAIPNLRGGGEYGREWHEAGMLENKQNVFDDFTAAAYWLMDNNYTCSEKLAVSGGSNGGLLVGAFAAQTPYLCRVIYCAVPLLDMVNYHTFGLANIWAEEYGSSEDPEQFKYLHAYSPYHNVGNGVDYPTMLITGSENDARVDPLHARKMVARLQEADPDGEPILLLVRKASGHGGGTTLSDQIEQRAQTWAFLMDRVGLQVPD
ncbi:S9 family peptidase [candidate division LCP-89 bacterium B3_LCP]|uniref:prolyl oligopeptidase n=1 Tax=candidate division LCP-89 bacterium B3_LCP TaxID=2012998 RepID=A0A532UTV2_UNCL8|nr:MAG: S9 family peptidase [candidate division LCP-89 bacterium B3_LCP]